MPSFIARTLILFEIYGSPGRIKLKIWQYNMEIRHGRNFDILVGHCPVKRKAVLAAMAIK